MNTFNTNKNGSKKEIVEKTKKIINGFYNEHHRAINVVFDGLNSLLREWGVDPREILRELEKEGYKLVPGRSRNGIGFIKVFPPGTGNRNTEQLKKYL